MELIKIKFKAEDFNGNRYTNNKDCAVARACNRVFKNCTAAADDANVGIYSGEAYNSPKIGSYDIVSGFGADKFYEYREAYEKYARLGGLRRLFIAPPKFSFTLKGKFSLQTPNMH